MNSWTEEELQAKLKENPELKIQQGNPLPILAPLLAKEHKYHAQRTEYNGVKYASKKEANHARELDLRKKAGEIDFWLRQVPLSLPGGITYRIDFVTLKQVVNTCLYEVHWIEVKGKDLPMGKLKRKQVEAIYGIEVEVV